jgi:hypothetical protein
MTKRVINLETGNSIALESAKRLLRKYKLPNTIENFKLLFVPENDNDVIIYVDGSITIMTKSKAIKKLNNMNYENAIQYIQNYTIAQDENDFIEDYSITQQISFDELEDRFNKSRINKDKPFTLQLKPVGIDINNGLLRFTFQNKKHFLNWFERVMKEKKTDSKDAVIDLTGSDKLTVDTLFTYSFNEIRGGCNKHGKHYEYAEKKITINNNKYIIKLNNVNSQDNLCGIRAVEILHKIKLNIDETQRRYNLKRNKPIEASIIQRIYNDNNKSTKQLLIITDLVGEYDFEKYDYIYHSKNHYKIVISCKLIEEDVKKIRRRLATWDTETRPDKSDMIAIGQFNKETGRVEKIKVPKLKATILHFYTYDRYTDTEIKMKFESDENTNCVIKFRDFLKNESLHGRYYYLFAHYGSKFDNFLFLSELTENDLFNATIIKQGTSILQFTYEEHHFRDSYKHMSMGLEKLCESYKVDVVKQTKIMYKNREYTNKEFCFYMKGLDYKDFLQLKYTEPEYWHLYNEYCLYDCISLYKLLKKYKEQSDILVDKLCYEKDFNMLGKLTVSAGAFTVLMKSSVEKLMSSNSLFICHDEDKEAFCRSMIRGGISFVNKLGKFDKPIVGYDITSQYPYSMLKCRIPSGPSQWLQSGAEYEADPGYYHIKNLKFNKDYKFKPIPSGVNENSSLEWKSGKEIKEAFVSNVMIEYLIDRFGLYDFQIEKALVSKSEITGDRVYSRFVNGLFAEKEEQDRLKDSKNPDYNSAYREIVKLCLNGVTGKCVENKADRRRFEFGDKKDNNSNHQINNAGMIETKKSDINHFITTGLGIYDMSKILLFEYLFCLGNPDNVVAIETDGIYFEKEYEDTFIENINNYQGTYDVKIGSKLGNIKREKESYGASYFLGKKFYHYSCMEKGKVKDVFKVKGIPLETIDEDGSDMKLITKEVYENIYNGKKQSFEFATMKKILFGNTSISHYMMKREIKPMGKYELYK